MQLETIQPDEFLAAVKPLLVSKDICGLTQLLRSRWSIEQVKSLLLTVQDDPNQSDVRKVAALSLGMFGGKCCQVLLAEQLKDPDPCVNEMAEHALWSIWLRSGNALANQELARGDQAMHDKDFTRAIAHFSAALQIDPDFAEAFNQRAIAHYCMDRYTQSLDDCKTVVKKVPCHFGAWAGMGHCYAHMGQLDQAIECYQKALEINPHLSCVAQAFDALKQCRADHADNEDDPAN